MQSIRRYIYFLGSIIIFLVILKYLLFDVYLPLGFFVFEVLSFLFVLGLVYLLLSINRKSKVLSNKLENSLNSQESLFKQEISILRDKLNEYKVLEINRKDLLTSREVLIENILQIVVSNDTTQVIVEALISLLKKYFEVGVAIGYVFSFDDQLFNVHFRLGIGEDFAIDSIKIGEGIHGQSLLDNQPIMLKDIPEEYMEIQSAIGRSKPKFIYVLPLVLDEKRRFVLEIATFKNEAIDQVWKEVVLQLEHK